MDGAGGFPSSSPFFFSFVHACMRAVAAAELAD